MQTKVNSYSELGQWFTAFNSGSLDVMIVEGSAGGGKSTIARDSIKGMDPKDYLWLEGRISAVCLYEKLLQHQDQPIYIDDVDGLYADKQCVNLLKCLCQTSADKTIMWNTKSIRGMPTAFTTRSKVCIITNSWRSLNKHVGAVQDRGLLILFHPTAQIIHDYVVDNLQESDWFDDEVFIFIGQHLPIIKEPSIRHYRNASLLKAAGMPWQEVLAESFSRTEPEAIVLKLLQSGISHNEQAKRFREVADMSERTYWRIKAALEDAGVA